ncbi:MAG: cupin domain-containing protein [Nitrospirae bacterium]|nr:cupin domain-containing protein [Nitrospirota bacterium]
MTEVRLTQELEEQAALHALGVLEHDDRPAFAVRLQGESLPLRQAVTAYHAVTDALADSVIPVVPRAGLRERLLATVAQEAARETAQFERVANALALNAVPVAPRASLRERLLARVEGHIDVKLDPLKGLTFVKASEGIWQEMAPGISVKALFFDPVSRRATALVRIEPGTRYAPHRHVEAEELYVLEGGCFCGGRELKPGDYHRAESDTEHHDTSSDEGCLLLVISSPQNEMLR